MAADDDNLSDVPDDFRDYLATEPFDTSDLVILSAILECAPYPFLKFFNFFSLAFCPVHVLAFLFLMSGDECDTAKAESRSKRSAEDVVAGADPRCFVY